MKKRIISLFLATAMLLSLTSCGKKNTNYAEMSLEEYIENIELPENLTISIDPTTVEERETVMVYNNPEFMEFDLDVLADQLLRNPVTETNELGYITQTESQQEILNLHIPSDDIAGFNYFWRPYFGISEKSTSPIEQFVQSRHNKMYYFADNRVLRFIQGLYDSADKTLDFASREEISETAQTFFTNNGIAQVEVQEVTAFDLGVLNTQYEIYQDFFDWYYAELLTGDDPTFATQFLESSQVSEPKKSEECYLVLCRQLIDGIPITTYDMVDMGGDSKWNQMTMSLIYTQDGIQVARLFYPVKEPDPSTGKEVEILSAAEALELTKAYYDKAILPKEYAIEEMELTYIQYMNDAWTELESLKPYWLVQVGYQQEYSVLDDKDNPIEGEVRGYDFLYFDAVTGDFFEGSPSGKPY